MTFTLLELVAVLATIAFCVALVYFVRTMKQVRRTAQQIEDTARHVSGLAPGIQRLVTSGESQMEELRVLTRRASDIVGDVNAVTGEASAATRHLIRGFEGQVIDRYGAMVAGARAGLAILKRVRGNGSDRDSGHAYDESTIEERMERHE
jgi:hypothetical protein